MDGPRKGSYGEDMGRWGDFIPPSWRERQPPGNLYKWKCHQLITCQHTYIHIRISLSLHHSLVPLSGYHTKGEIQTEREQSKRWVLSAAERSLLLILFILQAALHSVLNDILWVYYYTKPIHTLEIFAYSGWPVSWKNSTNLGIDERVGNCGLYLRVEENGSQ